MKRISYIILIVVAFLFLTCTKRPELKVYKLDFVSETIEKTSSTAKMTVEYSYPTKLESVNVILSENENLSGAMTAAATITETIFTAEFADLKYGTKYYYCYEYSNGMSLLKTDVKSFETDNVDPLEVRTIEVVNIGVDCATCKGEVVSDGGGEVTERGVCWSTTQDPTLDNEHATSGTGLGTFSCNITGLNANTTYYVRAYARNGTGLAFGDVKQFKTNEIVVEPSVSTVEIKSVTASSAIAVGNVSSDGGSEITYRGFCWSLSENPTVDDYHIEVEGTTGSFEGAMTGLQANKTYHVKAFAINSVGTSYGEELTFTTLEGLPVVVTSSVTEITATTAKCGGNITDQGASNVTEKGICWSLEQNPTTADYHANGGTGLGDYTCQMTELTPNATYYVRAYATNSQGTTYGAEVSFTAMEGLPSVVTNDVTNITSTTAKASGNVTDQGASAVTERGFCWNTEHSPSLDDSHVNCGTGAGNFTADIANLNPGTAYYIRAYVVNAQGMSYGNEIEFKTTATLPVVTTGEVTDITQTTAVGGGNVTFDGGAAVTERGVCWGTTPNPTIDGSHTASGSGTGTFTANITGLAAGTIYHVRAYAINSQGTSYGNDVTFTTTATLPTVTTAQVSNITQTTALGGGNVTFDGGAAVTERGICWGINANPTTNDQYATSGTGTGGFTANITGLTANTTYHVRAYAKNSEGTNYGSDVTFTTSESISAPTVTTSAVTNITQTTAVGGGNVTADGGATVTERGICWSTSQNPTTSGTHSNSGTGIGDYTVQMSGLTANTTYYVRAYAVNEAGTSYGEEKYFETLNVITPTVFTNEVEDITQTTAICGGNITDDGGATITLRGVCWNTFENPTIENSHTTDGSGTGSFTSSITGLSPNTTYFVRAYATNNAGTSYGEQKVFSTLDPFNGHEYVDLGLPSGTLWATCNVGATNPEDCGDHYAWGEATTKTIYNWTTYQWCNGSSTTLTKYNTSSNYGIVDNKTVIGLEDDVAYINWGGNWRIPTKTEMEELKNNCTLTWTTQNGVYGRKATGSNGESIFLPAGGYRFDGSIYLMYGYGAYWSSSLEVDRPIGACSLGFYSGPIYVDYGYDRCSGRSVRPVCTLSK